LRLASLAMDQTVAARSAKADAAVGCLIGGMVGDVLGAGVEGWPAGRISTFSEAAGGLLRDFFPCIHMGNKPHKGYVGPPKNDHDVQYARFGMYTDDTNMSLALATSLVECQGLDGAHAARKYAEFYFDTSEPTRFVPDSAERVMQCVLDGIDYRETGLPPHFPFQGGSYANGGMMRIAPLGIAFRNAEIDEMYRAAEEAIRSSHVHPESVDAAALQACAVAACARHRESATDVEFDMAQLLSRLQTMARTGVLHRRLKRVLEELQLATVESDDAAMMRKILTERPEDECIGSGFDFQIGSIDLLPCVMWVAGRYYKQPEEAIIRAVAVGGDTDTLASCVGTIVGALHGAGWIPSRWWSALENGKRGRDFVVALAEQLSELDARSTLTFGGDDDFPIFEEGSI